MGGKPRILLRSGTVEWTKGSETSNKGFGLIRYWVPMRTLKFDFGIGVLLGMGAGVIGTKRVVAAEESVGDHGCTGRLMSLCYVCLWKRSYLWARCLRSALLMTSGAT